MHARLLFHHNHGLMQSVLFIKIGQIDSSRKENLFSMQFACHVLLTRFVFANNKTIISPGYFRYELYDS